VLERNRVLPSFFIIKRRGREKGQEKIRIEEEDLERARGS
jgi:hypothetical protein